MFERGFEEERGNMHNFYVIFFLSGCIFFHIHEKDRNIIKPSLEEIVLLSVRNILSFKYPK